MSKNNVKIKNYLIAIDKFTKVLYNIIIQKGGDNSMWIYKRSGGKYTMLEYVDSNDSFDVEERILKILRKNRETRGINDIKSKFTGLFTVYYFNGSYALIASDTLLNEDGSVKVTTNAESKV